MQESTSESQEELNKLKTKQKKNKKTRRYLKGMNAPATASLVL